MDLSFVKQKLAPKPQGKKFEKIDYSKIFWKPTVGTHQIRILPSQFDSKWPLREMAIHYGYTKAPIFALTNWGKNDPIVDFVSKLRKSPDPAEWKLANKFQPKTRYFAAVLVRGEESKGPRLWEVGKLVNDQLLKVANDEDYGDFTDENEGRDFTVEGVEDIAFGKKVVKSSLMPKVKTTKISENPEIVKKALTEQPDILAINKQYEFEALKELFEKWVSGNPEEETASEENNDELPIIESNQASQIEEVKGKGKAKTKSSAKFDALFSSDKPVANPAPDDLPF